MQKIKQENIEFILNDIETTQGKINLMNYCKMALAEGVFTEFYIHYPLVRDLIIEHNNRVDKQ